MRIALSYDADGQVFMYLDEKGRDELVAELKALEFPKNRTSNEHFHLMTEDWGDGTLDTIHQSELAHTKQALVHHLKVMLRPSEDHVWANDVLSERDR